MEKRKYIGFKDKNGKEIYENDLVITDEDGWVGKVVKEGKDYICVDPRPDHFGFATECKWKKYEVIENGNKI